MGISLKSAAKGFAGSIGGLPGVLAADKLVGGGAQGPKAPTGYDPERMKLIQERMDKLQGKLDATPGPKLLGQEGPSYAAKDLSQNPEFAAARSRAFNQVNAGAQTAQDAIQRKFAAMGAGNSGSAIKQQQLILQNAEDKKAEADAAINEQIFNANQKEQDKAFQSEEAAKSRGLQRETYNSDAAFKDAVFRFDSNSKLAAIQLQAEQADRDAQDQAFNKEMALYQQKHSGGLLGAGGFLGTGIGI